MLGLAKVKAERGSLRHQSGDAAYAITAAKTRSAHNLQRNFYLARALDLADKPGVNPTSSELSVIAEALRESGRLDDAEGYLRRGLLRAEHNLETLSIRSELASLCFKRGENAKARNDLLGIADTFEQLSSDARFDRDLMRYRAGAAMMKILSGEARAGMADNRAVDFERFFGLTTGIGDRALRTLIEVAVAEFHARYPSTPTSDPEAIGAPPEAAAAHPGPAEIAH